MSNMAKYFKRFVWFSQTSSVMYFYTISTMAAPYVKFVRHFYTPIADLKDMSSLIFNKNFVTNAVFCWPSILKATFAFHTYRLCDILYVFFLRGVFFESTLFCYKSVLSLPCSLTDSQSSWGESSGPVVCMLYLISGKIIVRFKINWLFNWK